MTRAACDVEYQVSVTARPGIEALAALTAVASVAAGYFAGRLDGGIPWSATAAEQAAYDWSTGLTIVAGILLVATTGTWLWARKPRAGRIVGAILAAAVSTTALFFASYGIGALR